MEAKGGRKDNRVTSDGKRHVRQRVLYKYWRIQKFVLGTSYMVVKGYPVEEATERRTDRRRNPESLPAPRDVRAQRLLTLLHCIRKSNPRRKIEASFEKDARDLREIGSGATTLMS